LVAALGLEPRRSDKLAALIPQLYVKGMSTRDLGAALTGTLEVEGASKSTVSPLCGQLRPDFARWQNRDLSDLDACLTALRFPEADRKRVRTANL
jgi:transposase-like protein